MTRRTFLYSTFGNAFGASLAASLPVSGRTGNPPRILLRNAWQSINIGDIAHYLGLLELIEKFGIEVEIHLWPDNLENGARELLNKRFPNVIVLNDEAAKSAAFQECDFFLHGSSASFARWRELERWHRETGKPFGVFGISLPATTPELIQTLSKAEFVFFRETHSLQLAIERDCTSPIMEFGPDTAFGVVKTRNDEAAISFLREHNLQEGQFMCCIPRYRWTPHWMVDSKRTRNAEHEQRNQQMKEHDHAPLRDAIIAVTRQTDLKVLIVCEDQTQILLGKEMLFDKLPADVKKRVVWRDRYWLTDEALSTYVRSAGLFGNEMHSPIMCVSNGIPAIVCRFDEQTRKGLMWRDIGLDEWLFDLDNPSDLSRIAPTVLAIAKDPILSKAKTAKAIEIVRQRQKNNFEVLESTLKKAQEY